MSSFSLLTCLIVYGIEGSGSIVDLSNQIFNNYDFTQVYSGSQLRGAIFSGATLTNSYFTGLDLSNANFTGADLSGADLTDANLIGVDFTGVTSDNNTDFTNALCFGLTDMTTLPTHKGTPIINSTTEVAGLVGDKLVGAVFTFADLTGAHFAAVNLTNANLSGADASGADFSNCRLTGGDLSGANLTDANLIGVDFTDVTSDSNTDFTNALCFGLTDMTTFPTHKGTPIINSTTEIAGLVGDKLVGENLSGLNLKGVDFSGVNLTSANFSGSNLSESSFANANLSGTTFIGSNLIGVDFTDVTSDGNTDFTNAICLGFADMSTLPTHNGTPIINSTTGIGSWVGNKLVGVNFSGLNLEGVDFTGVNLTGVNLTGVNLTGAILTGADLTGAVLSSVKGFTQEDYIGTNIKAYSSMISLLQHIRLCQRNNEAPLPFLA